jgi:hypothetical protein
MIPGLFEVKSTASGLYLKKAVVDGVETEPYFRFQPGPVIHTVELTFSDRPARLGGTVRRDGKPAGGQRVVVASWPTFAPDGFPYFTSAAAASDGTFRIADLAPGTYRAVSVGPETWARIEMPGMLSSLLSAGGVEFKLAEGESRTLSLEAEPR